MTTVAMTGFVIGRMIFDHQIPYGASVDDGRFVDLDGQGLQIADEKQCVEGNGGCHIREYERELLFQAEEQVDLVDREQENERSRRIGR